MFRVQSQLDWLRDWWSSPLDVWQWVMEVWPWQLWPWVPSPFLSGTVPCSASCHHKLSSSAPPSLSAMMLLLWSQWIMDWTPENMSPLKSLLLEVMGVSCIALVTRKWLMHSPSWEGLCESPNFWIVLRLPALAQFTTRYHLGVVMQLCDSLYKCPPLCGLGHLLLPDRSELDSICLPRIPRAP